MKVVIFDIACPHCGIAEGPITIGEGLWFYCQQHKVKWLAGWDPFAEDQNETEQQRVYNEVGLGNFKYIGLDSEGYERHRGGRESLQ